MPGPEAADWLPYEEALDRVVGRCRPLPDEEVDAGEAAGRALAEEIRSRVDHPPWDNSAMDGFAVRAADVRGASRRSPVVLPESGDVPAGAFPEGPLRGGTAVRVMTGAPVPEGATGVVRVEHTDGGRDGRVTFHDDSDAERNIRRAGEDVRRGDTLLAAGEELGPAAVGALRMAGRERVRVGRLPRVGIVATGDELAGPEDFERVLAGRRIADTNSPALAAAVRGAGGIPVPLGIARDDPADLRARLEDPDGWDALVTTAGVSVGDRDHVKAVLEAMGLERVFWRPRVRPGSALLFGLLDGRPVFGLPGNPVSALVGFEAFVGPALRRLAGHARTRPRRIAVRAAGPVRSQADLTHFFRVRLRPAPDGPPAAELTGPQGSGMITSMLRADALLVVPEGVEGLAGGDPAEAVPLTRWEAPA